MKKMSVVLVGILMAASIPVASMAADVNVNVQVAQPEPAAVAAEMPPPLEAQTPEMVAVPSGNNAVVYMVPNVYGVYFHEGAWFRYYNGVWFRSAVYNSGWVVVAPAIVPRVVIGVYPEYAMYLPAGYFRIGWGDFHSHWRGWGYSHWHRHGWFRDEIRHRADRRHHIEKQRGEWSHGRGNGPSGFHGKPVGHKPGPNIKKTDPHGNVKKPVTHGTVNKTTPHGTVHKTSGQPHGTTLK